MYSQTSAGSADIVPPEVHPPARQLDALTSLRFFAAFYVLLFHNYLIFFGVDRSSPIYFGFSGVTFFFVLSGFILAHNYSSVDFRNKSNLRRYLRARIARIYPVYLLSLGAGLPFFVSKLGLLKLSLYKVLFALSALLAPFALQAWVPGAACAINCPSWSISTEWFFYLVFPLVLHLILRSPLVWLSATVLCSLVLWLFLDSFWQWLVSGTSLLVPPGTDHRALVMSQFVKFFPIWRLPEFVLGITVYALWVRWQYKDMVNQFLVASLIGAILIYVFSDRIGETAINNGLSAIVWVPLILAAANLSHGFLHWPAMVFLGRISFSLYLLHVPVTMAVSRLNSRALDSGLALDGGEAFFVASVVAMGISAAVFIWVEEPGRRLVLAGRR